VSHEKNGFLLALLLFFVYLPAVHAQEYGKLHILQQRADHVIKKKNAFFARVLTSYNIPHESTHSSFSCRLSGLCG
jgi:hypothetical protein